MPRPQLKPTAEDRKMVKTLAAFGVRHEEIARRIGIRSPKTLRKHFREELDFGALDANLQVSGTAYKMATSGKFPVMTMFWLKSQAGWNDRPAGQLARITPPPFIVAQANEVQP